MRKNRGIAMIVVMMALGLLAITSLAVAYLSNRGLMQSRMYGETDEAFFAAQAGLNLKVAQYATNDADLDEGMQGSEAHYRVTVYEAGETVPELPGAFTVPADHIYLVARGYHRNPALGGPTPREVRLGTMLQRSATVFTASALAGNLLTVSSGGYTDTWDSSTGSSGNHALAHVGVYNASGTVNVSSGSYVGYDGGSALADVIVPTGHTGSVTGTAGSEFAAQTVNPFLTAPDPVTVRSHGSTDLVFSSSTTITPSFAGGEYVIKAKDFKVENNSTLTVDVSGVPDGTTVYLDVNEFNLDKGTFEVYDNDVALYGSGATEVDLQVYATKVLIKDFSQFRTLNNEPKRMVVYADDEMTLDNLVTSYMVARAKNSIDLTGSSEIYGSVLGESSVSIGGSSTVHYDQNLQSSGSGATGGGTLQFVSYQKLR